MLGGNEMAFSDSDDANPPELPELPMGWHTVVNGKCVYCGRAFDTQMVADSTNSPDCEE
jgi:hypothetical protein